MHYETIYLVLSISTAFCCIPTESPMDDFVETTTLADTTTTTSLSCPVDWVQNGMFCYTITPGKMFGDQADSVCDGLYSGATAASIHSGMENSFIFTLFSDTHPTPNGDPGIWFGLMQVLPVVTPPADYFWSDGTPFDYSNWDTSNNEPDAYDDSVYGQCALLIIPGGMDPMSPCDGFPCEKWFDINCNEMNYAVCKVPVVSG